MVLYNRFYTLIFGTTDFYLHDRAFFYEQKELAGLEQLKELLFIYSLDGKYSSENYEACEKVTKFFNLIGEPGLHYEIKFI